MNSSLLIAHSQFDIITVQSNRRWHRWFFWRFIFKKMKKKEKLCRACCCCRPIVNDEWHRVRFFFFLIFCFFLRPVVVGRRAAALSFWCIFYAFMFDMYFPRCDDESAAAEPIHPQPRNHPNTTRGKCNKRKYTPDKCLNFLFLKK